ncbi:cob(I)yrinic acid a,c-diamide adenosyltransferase [Alteribacter natronophilus]|uniref:cob(I)yrinic acid a,c-diamide adenosyltransferase n=1 Tax=Alteribacter natronophilus TaxID=2583810 RepID=UPI00110D9478|nr:cob(I)yrinic acid a,c-diamide adenosyltransferase [Alteribacter natronophilus]TMW73641.1 cob(I)yrinic acid a,c-diamide adenosyltransferase [Alteribacter natronophilus]
MKIYTKKGDQGKTSLIGKRVAKNHLRVNAYGTVDELNSFIGRAVAGLGEKAGEDVPAELTAIQQQLFDLGADLANVTDEPVYKTKEAYIDTLEKAIDRYWDEAPEIRTFVLPGGSQSAADLHVCRTVARRAEREITAAMTEEEIPGVILQYVNRLSDYLFAAARVVNFREGNKDVLYKSNSDVFK